MLPLAGAGAVLQRREHGDHALQAGIEISMAAGVVPDLGERVPIMVLEDVREAGFRLYGGCESRPIAPRTGLPVPGDRDIDDGRVELAHLFITKAEAGKR